jgi:hypothetical protein
MAGTRTIPTTTVFAIALSVQRIRKARAGRSPITSAGFCHPSPLIHNVENREVD